MLRRTAIHLSLLAVSLAGPDLVHAAELGEARVASHVGQPLVADIELTMLEDAANPVGVRLASLDVYNGAGIAMPPVLSSLNLTVMRREGHQFLHVTSLRPVDSEHLHLYLELTEKGQRVVRLVTLWLTPDPHPAPARVEAAPALAAVSAPAPAAVPARRAPVLEARVQPLPRPAPKRTPELAAKPAEGATKSADGAPKSAARGAAKPAGAEHAAAPAPLPLPSAQPASGAACVPQAEAKICAALDYKNAELKEQLGHLEDKVKVLQVALGAAPAKGAAETPPAETPPAAVPAGPRPISAIKPLVPRKPRAAPPPEEGGLPWGWISAGFVLLGLGAASALVLRRRAKSRNVDIPDEPGVLERLKQRFAARTKAAPAPAEAAEPTLE